MFHITFLGLILDAIVMSDRCNVCHKIAGIKDESTRRQRKQKHQESGTCGANYEGLYIYL